MKANIALKNSTIMMIDDESIMIELIQIFLDDAGYQQFHGVSNSLLAIEQIAEKDPDILLLDLVMPNLNGYQILEQVRANPKTKHLPVIILTSSSDSTSKLKALELGATDFLAKPVDQSELVLRVRNTLTFKAYQDRLAYYDPLTGLPNKKLCLEKLSKALNNFTGHLSVLNIRLGEYRKLAEGLGPKVSESLLKAVAERIQTCIRSSDVISNDTNINTNQSSHNSTRVVTHLGGDEFSILLTRIQQVGDASYVGDRLMEAFAKPLLVENRPLFISLHIGISVFPEDGCESQELLSKASGAANLLVDSNESGFQFYSSKANQRLKDKIELQQDLRTALSNEEFQLVYQPQIDAKTYKVKGAEALLRWVHPTKGFISPDIFIPLAEESGLMVDIGNRVIREACKQAVELVEMGIYNTPIAINVSGRQFRSDDFLHSIELILSETGAPATAIVIEITESLAMSDVVKTTAILHSLRTLGIHVSVDDFGTGYSSLSYLKDFPIDELKIDKIFVDGLPENKGDQAITSAIISIAQKLGFKIVAEGVETKPQLDYLSAAGCDLIQGYLFSKPLSKADFIEFCHKEVSLN